MYKITTDNQLITLTDIPTGRSIKNLKPEEAYSILNLNSFPKKIEELMVRIEESLPNDGFYFGNEIKNLLSQSFHPILQEAISEINRLENITRGKND